VSGKAEEFLARADAFLAKADANMTASTQAWLDKIRGEIKEIEARKGTNAQAGDASRLKELKHRIERYK
jgi:hypothetical protein